LYRKESIIITGITPLAANLGDVTGIQLPLPVK
jgi:hypothetical protein